MIRAFQDLFVCPEDNRRLVYSGEFSSDGRWANGILSDGVKEKFVVSGGIPEAAAYIEKLLTLRLRKKRK